METHVITLDAKRDQEFLKQQRRDPVLKSLLEPGDRVVVCAHCRMVLLEDTWTEIKGKFGHGTETLSALPIDTPRVSRWGSPGASAPAGEPPTPPPPVQPRPVQPPPVQPRPVPPRPVQPPPVHAQPPREPYRPPVSHTTPPRPTEPPPARPLRNLWSRFVNRARRPRVVPRQPDSATLKLKEIPFQLREVPFTLREVNPY